MMISGIITIIVKVLSSDRKNVNYDVGLYKNTGLLTVECLNSS